MADRLPPEALDEWAQALRERFGLSGEDVPIALILNLAKDVADGVARPAAPFSAFVAGLVAGRAGGSAEQVREAVDAVSELAGTWQGGAGEGGAAQGAVEQGGAGHGTATTDAGRS